MASIDGFDSAFPLHLEVRDLRLIAAVAGSGGLTQAASVLHLTQSTLSHHLADLESRLGKPLFYRTGRRLVLTPFGTRFRNAADPILAKLSLIERDLETDSTKPVMGEVRFATECYTTYAWFGRIAKPFRLKWPDVELRLMTKATARPLAELESGGLDIAITTNAPRAAKFHNCTLFSDELVAIVSRDHPWAKMKRVTPDQFRHVHLLTYSPNPLESDFVRDVLLPAGVLPIRATGIQLTEALLQFSKAGLGVAVVARWAVQEALRDRELVPVSIGINGLYRTWSAVWLRKHPNPEWLNTFAQLLRSLALKS